MRDAMLARRIHLAEGDAVTIGQEHRIIAEATGPARRPDQRARAIPPEPLRMTAGPGKRQRTAEAGAPLAGPGRARLVQLVLDRLHGEREIAGLSREPRRVDAGPVPERRHAEPGI